MADELRIRATLQFEKDSTFTSMLFGPRGFDVAGRNCLHNRQNVGTDEEAIVMGDCPAGGYFMAVNRDSTNFVELRGASGGADLVRLEPGDVCLFRLTDDATLYAIANTAAVELEYVVIDP